MDEPNHFNPDSDKQLKANRRDIPNLDSHWNYRVIRKTHDCESIINPGEKWVTFGIHEVYYTDGKPSMTTEDAMEPHGETLEELLEDMKHFQLALDKPVLNYEDF